MTAAKPAPVPPPILLARQPILNRAQRIIAYELLYRTPTGGSPAGVAASEATSTVLDSALLVGVAHLTGGRPAYINFDRQMILMDIPAVLPPNQLVVELLETETLDPELLQAVQRLRAKGYHVVFDDYTFNDPRAQVVSLASVVKVDFRKTDPAQQQELARKLNGQAKLLAEKVETYEELRQALQWGYHLFQGFYFGQPELVRHKRLTGSKLAYLRLLQQAAAPEADFCRLEQIIKTDPSLVHRLLRYVNSAWAGRRAEISSVRHALVLLGEQEIRRWIVMVALAGLARGKPEALVVNALVRARACEMLAPFLGVPADAPKLFLLGLYSLLDAVLDEPMEEILSGLPLPTQVRSVLAHQPHAPQHLVDALELTLAWERADWDRFFSITLRYPADAHQVCRVYLEASQWADRALAT